ncbi:MAG TPA: acyl-CoA dehydrogenase family protein [Actinomycetota bacterium]|nr:acyl-CoA dehydrogenase family protein [Actinomycetota bacterium]
MDFDLNDEQRELRDAARRYLEREAPIGYARAMMDDARGYRDEVWKQMSVQGWLALPMPVEHDGLDMGMIALSILVAEMGRVVAPGPYLSTVLAGMAIADSGSDEQKRALLPRIASGDLVATVAAGPGDVEESGGHLRGERRFVADGAIAEAIVVVAHTTDDEPALYLAEPTERRTVSTMDQTRNHAHLRFDGARAERLASSDLLSVHRLLDRAALLIAAESLGGAERVTEMAVEYAKARTQFGRPIGSFQAVKHRAADMLVDVESLRNAVYYAAWAAEREQPDASLAISMAKAFAADAYRRVAQSGIQIHGGIGFTWEHDMHLYFKRAKGNEVAYGDATFHRERVAQLLKTRV